MFTKHSNYKNQERLSDSHEKNSIAEPILQHINKILKQFLSVDINDRIMHL
jgi:hypothetical protein